VNGAGGAPDTTPKDGNTQPANGEPKPEPDDNDEPPVKERKTAKDFIIERQKQKIAKLEAQKGKSDDDDADDADIDDDDDVLPEDRKAILKTVAPVLQPFIEKSLQAEDEAELQKLFEGQPRVRPVRRQSPPFYATPKPTPASD